MRLVGWFICISFCLLICVLPAWRPNFSEVARTTYNAEHAYHSSSMKLSDIWQNVRITSHSTIWELSLHPWQRRGGCVSSSELVWQIKQPNHRCNCVFVIVRHFCSQFRGRPCRFVLLRVLGIWRCFISDYVLEIKWNLNAVSLTEKGWLCQEPLLISVLVWQIKQLHHRCTYIFVIVHHFRSPFRGQTCRCVLVRVLGIWRCFVSDYVREMKLNLRNINVSVFMCLFICVLSILCCIILRWWLSKCFKCRISR